MLESLVKLLLVQRPSVHMRACAGLAADQSKGCSYAAGLGRSELSGRGGEASSLGRGEREVNLTREERKEREGFCGSETVMCTSKTVWLKVAGRYLVLRVCVVTSEADGKGLTLISLGQFRATFGKRDSAPRLGKKSYIRVHSVL
jgi:hypothetical protein